MKIKYMGSSDVRKLNKGEDFGGRLATPLDRDITWGWDNKHVIDTDEFDGVSEDVWSLLLEESDFKDVSDLSRIPTNEAQQIWRGMKKSEDAPAGEGEEARKAAEALGATDDSGTADTDEEEAAGGGVSEAADGPPRTTTTGGSTRGSRTRT